MRKRMDISKANKRRQLKQVDAMGLQSILVENEEAAKPLALYHKWQPVWVILPHFVIRNLVQIRPNRRSLVGLDQFAFQSASYKNRDMKLIAVQKLKEQFTGFLHPGW